MKCDDCDVAMRETERFYAEPAKCVYLPERAAKASVDSDGDSDDSTEGFYATADVFAFVHLGVTTIAYECPNCHDSNSESFIGKKDK